MKNTMENKEESKNPFVSFLDKLTDGCQIIGCLGCFTPILFIVVLSFIWII
jgi:hypothetical protein